MPSFDDFIESLTQQQEKLISIGYIKGSRDHALVANQASKPNFKDQQKGKGKNLEVRKEKFLKLVDEYSSNHKGKKKDERSK